MNRTIIQHLDKNDVAIRWCWQEWVNNGRHNGQNGGNQLRTTVEQKDRAIVRATITTPDSLLSTIHECGLHTCVQLNPWHMTESRIYDFKLVYCWVWLECCWAWSMRNCSKWGHIVFSDESCFLLCPDNNYRRFLRLNLQKFLYL